MIHITNTNRLKGTQRDWAKPDPKRLTKQTECRRLVSLGQVERHMCQSSMWTEVCCFEQWPLLANGNVANVSPSQLIGLKCPLKWKFTKQRDNDTPRLKRTTSRRKLNAPQLIKSNEDGFNEASLSTVLKQTKDARSKMKVRQAHFRCVIRRLPDKMPHNGQVIMGNEVAIVAFLHSPPPFLSWLAFYLGQRRRALGVMTSSGGRAEITAFETRAVWWGDAESGRERRRRQIHSAPLQGAAEKCQGRFSVQSWRKWGRSLNWRIRMRQKIACFWTTAKAKTFQKLGRSISVCSIYRLSVFMIIIVIQD